MILSHRIQLDPTVKQTVAFNKAAGCARYTWNWAVQEWEKTWHETGKSPNVNELKRKWNSCKPAWVYESPKDANQQPFGNLQKAYRAYFKKTAKKPHLKTKRKSRASFYVSNDKFKLLGNRVKLPKIGWVRMTEELRFVGRVVSATVSRTADRWFIAVQVDTVTAEKPGTECIGMDLGLKHFATLSTGEVIDAPKPLKRSLDKLRRLSRQHSRKQSGSKNRSKCAMRLARHHARVACIRKDFLHKVTTSLVSKAKTLVIEDLSVQGMQRLWGRAVSDAGLYECRRQLTYKCQKTGVALVLADRWYPSTQLCSGCGARQKLGLADRTYQCHCCGMTKDRDLNAALNLSTVGYTGIQACGQEGSDWKHVFLVKPSWMKQELNLATSTSCHK